MEKLLLATKNPGKIREFKELLRDAPFQLISLEDAGIMEGVEEVGASFEENAVLKARTYASLTGLLTLADDSGLDVDALDGKPGIHSARYGGPGLSDEERVQLLLKNLQGIPWEQRAARFRCVIAIAEPSGALHTVAGVVEGVIQYKPEGANGFGYDPVFYLPHRGCTTAQLSAEEKNRISHRGQAARKALEVLRCLMQSYQQP